MSTSRRSLDRRITVALAVLTMVMLAACGASRSPAKPPASTLPAALTSAPSTVSAADPATSGRPTATTTSLVTAATTRASSPATSSAAATSAAPPKGQPWFVGLRADGTLEAWAKDGKRVAIKTCAVDNPTPGRSANCSINGVALTARSMWYLLREGASGTSLMRAPLSGGAPVAVAGVHTAIDEGLGDLAVGADDATVWFTHSYPGDGLSILQRWHDGNVTDVASRVTGVAVSPSGQRLAYARHGFDPFNQPVPKTAIVVVDLVGGTERALERAADDGPPVSLTDLSWSGDNHHLLFNESWEGSSVHVIDVDRANRVNDAVTPTVPSADATRLGLRGLPVADACWTSATKVTLGSWAYPSGDGTPATGDVVAFDLASSRSKPVGVNVFGQGLACRDDGAVAIVNSTQGVGDLLVIRPDATTTRLGTGYQRVFGA